VAVALQFDRVTKYYKDLFGRVEAIALREFALSVEPGEIFGFLGPNGAGKTTALHVAMGFVRASSGSGTMLGKPFGDATTRRRVGFLAESVALYHRTAIDAVRFYGALNGMRDPELSKRARLVLEQVGLAEDGHRNIGKFSRGMLQRVGLAQALVNDPDLLVLDEPTSALDPVARVQVRELLLAAKRAGKTVFLSSHMLSEIELICDRVAFLVKGSVVREGKTSELLEDHSISEIEFRDVAPGALAAMGISAQVQSQNGTHRSTVRSAEQRPFIERIWQAGGEVVSVNPARRSLEELFVALAENNDKADT
jgi:ABC-2 type transport system ATP-binding protein